MILSLTSQRPIPRSPIRSNVKKSKEQRVSSQSRRRKSCRSRSTLLKLLRLWTVPSKSTPHTLIKSPTRRGTKSQSTPKWKQTRPTTLLRCKYLVIRYNLQRIIVKLGIKTWLFESGQQEAIASNNVSFLIKTDKMVLRRLRTYKERLFHLK
jgi:uncharacterized membrane-anchored protein